MINLSWQPEPVPRRADIIIGFQDAAEALYHRMQSIKASPADEASVLMGQSFLALKADFTDLPWVDGMHYLSAGQNGTRLYTPTHIKPNVPYAWIEASLSASLTQPRTNQQNRCDILYLPDLNSVIFADRYQPLATAQQDNLLAWYEHYSQTLAALGG